MLLTTCPPLAQVLGPLADIIQADRKWQERPDKHGHQHPGSPGSKRIKSNAGATRVASFTLEDLTLQHTLYNDGMCGLVHLELKVQGGHCLSVWLGCLFIMWRWEASPLSSLYCQ